MKIGTLVSVDGRAGMVVGMASSGQHGVEFSDRSVEWFPMAALTIRHVY